MSREQQISWKKFLETSTSRCHATADWIKLNFKTKQLRFSLDWNISQLAELRDGMFTMKISFQFKHLNPVGM